MKFLLLILFACLCRLVAAPPDRLVISQRLEPRTYNPVFALDASTRDLLRLVHGRLARLNPVTQTVEPLLAESWLFAPDGKSCLVRLRRGVLFSDGQPFTAADVEFSLQLYLDPKLASPQRDLLSPGGKPLQVEVLSPYQLRLRFAAPFAPGPRLFDGIAMLPRHILAAPYREGKLAPFWNLGATQSFAGLGPFVPARYEPGRALHLVRNPRYFQPGKPRLQGVEIRFFADATAEFLRFQQGETDMILRPPARPFEQLGREFTKLDAGAGLDFHFLFFNLNERVPSAVQARQSWFRQQAFRQAVSLALDREAMVRLAFDGRATPLRWHVTPGNREWLRDARPPRRDVGQARTLLAQAGFQLRNERLHDAQGQPVAFTLAVNAANLAQSRLAAILQQDLQALGIVVQIVALEFRSLIQRVTQARDFDAALLAISSGDADPNAEMNIWPLAGPMHVWNLAPAAPTDWEQQLDRLMSQQQQLLNRQQRFAAYSEVQRLVGEQLPILPLVSPHLLIAHRQGLRGVFPSLLPPFALWNAEELYWGGAAR